MRPVAQKPQEQIVIYSDAPTDYAINLIARTSTTYMKVRWWDGTQEIKSNADGRTSQGGKHFQQICFASKKSDTPANKRIVITACDVDGNNTGNIIYFSCSKASRRTHYFSGGGGSRNQQVNKIDVSTCSQLESLKCNHNTLSSLGDVKACRNLGMIACTGNSFASIDVSKCKNLTKFFCNHNFDLNNLYLNSNLKRLGVSSTNVAINPPENSKLEEIIAKDTGQEFMFFSNLPYLARIDLSPENYGRGYNPITQNRYLNEVYLNNCYNLGSVNIGKNGSGLESPYFSYIEMNGAMAEGEPDVSVYGLYIPITSRRIKLQNSNLNSSTLDNMFSGINANGYTYDSSVRTQIYVENNPGSTGCDTTIATAKGYSVYT